MQKSVKDVRRDPHMHNGEACLLIRILEQYGLRFSEVQLEKVLRIVRRELKVRRKERTQL